MKAFNPDKELNKIQRGNKNKIIFCIVALLLIISIGSTYALYQVRYSKRIIYTKVAPFSNKDINIIAVFLDNQPTTDFPEKNSGYRYDKIVCDNGSTATFDHINWELNLKAKKKDKCNVYFVKTYKDASGANAPELYQGLIPVTYDNSGNVKVADIDTDWYNYGDKRWANAVLVDRSNYGKYVIDGEYQSNTIIPMSEILQMYVWIPRYKYQLFNVNNEEVEEQEIKIEFENNIENSGDIECKYINNNNGTITENCTEKGTSIVVTNNKWYTHPAFNFKGTLDETGTELPGIWVGKFEPSGNNISLKIVPNAATLQNVNIAYMYNASRNIVLEYANNYSLKIEEIDSHMMKNVEWGAMAYLTQSKYGRCNDSVCSKVTSNSTYTTGYASQAWNTANGVLASTTGNMYGIYDTAGCAWEYVMGNMVNSSGVFYASQSGFSQAPDTKYYDAYTYDPSNLTFERGHLGDATREILKEKSKNIGWNDNRGSLVHGTYSWFDRGGRVEDGSSAGVFSFDQTTGIAYNRGNSFRVVLTAQDGNE